MSCMKRIIVILAFLFCGLSATAQSYGNEWINFSQQYFKIKVWRTGVYRIDQQTLLSAGIPIGNFDPKKIQLFHNGQQQYIYIDGENDGSFDANDFIEFVGHPNDGSFDTQLYADSTWQPNPHFSNFSDTSIYFLTWSAASNGNRFIPQNDTAFQNYTPSSYCLRESFFQQTYGYNRGMFEKQIEYTESEGWCGAFGNFNGGTLAVALNTTNAYSSGPDALLTTSVGGINNLNHSIWISYPSDTLRDNYTTQVHRQYTIPIQSSLLSPSTTTFNYGVYTPSTSGNDWNSFYFSSLIYPHTFDFENNNTFEFSILDQPQQSFARIDISNFNAGGITPVLYDITNHRRVLLSGTGSNWQALIPNDNTLTPKQCLLSAINQITPILSINKIDYVANNPGHFNNFQSYPVDSAFLMVTHRSLWGEANSYKSYRDGTTGNRTLLADIDELTDQFSYGIPKHPMAIKNFCRFILDSWMNVGPAQHLLLIGKSISPADFRNDPASFAACLVPSYGVPTSDILLTSGINGSLYEPMIPVGRICARTGNDVIDYLDKVREYESAQAGPPQPWMKEMLHFGGGNDPQQQAQLAAYLQDFEGLMEGPKFGGHVTTYLKFTNSPIVINQSDSLQAQIDSGVAVMTFFGHASGSGFDQSTDEPSEYNNQGRYPLMIANSCYAGDFHAAQKSISEKFVLEPNKGAIGFIASVGLGVPQDLYLYSHAFFENASVTNYGASVGYLMKKTVQDIQIPNVESVKIVSQEMSLNGDPSIKINNWPKPDFAINESSIKFPSYDVTTNQDTFTVHILTRNIARATNDSFQVRIKRTFPDGSDSVYVMLRGNCYYEDDLALNLPVGGLNAAGVNLFSVQVDPADSVDELDNFLNNNASSSIFITSSDIIPVYPPRFAIYPSTTVKLKACTANPLAGVGTYLFEIDTIDLSLADSVPSMQHSPLFRTSTITDSGGVISWNMIGYPLRDSAVYYWRVANDSIRIDPANFKWQQSTFMFIRNKSGWAQSDFYQFADDGYLNIRYDTLGRRFSYVENKKNLTALTKGLPDGTQAGYNEIGYKLNNSPVEYNACNITPGVLVAVLDSTTLLPWNTCGNNFGQSNVFTVTQGSCNDPFNVIGSGTCRQRPENHFMFHYYSATEMQGMANLINAVPSGNYILVYSWYTANYSSVNPIFQNTFSGLGLDLSSLQDNVPFIMLTQKGNSNYNETIFGLSQTDTLTLSKLLSATWNEGSISSTVIGPARQWESLHWNQSPVEGSVTKDVATLNILGLNTATQRWDTLSMGISYTTSGKDTTLNWISASQYKYLRLQAVVEDDSLYTPPQMDYWRVYYEEAPECGINPNRTFSFYKNPLSEGDTLKVGIAIENIGNLPMDSLDVDFYLYNNARQRVNLATLRLDSLRVNSYLIANLRVDSTLGFSGVNSLWIEANPYNSRHQLEQAHFNNLAEVKFRIDRDQVNPILDVTFDGVHIMDQDIVSGKPAITIQLQDENRFLALNDTSKFKVYLKSPNSAASQRVYFNLVQYGQSMRFTPASLPKNSCKIEWQPNLSEDGTYTLEVEAADISNNESGKYNYKISFEVINRSTITEVLNYPNPFSTSTRFVFTLTGNQVPTYMKIQIMTVSGKIVREITQSELGNIHIGRNITEYAWDGKDEFGDQLANGLYLYRVVSSINGQEIEKRQTDADSYFKKGWGKMYLMR